MPESYFNLVFKGEISPDTDICEVKKNISSLLKTDFSKVEEMLNGKAVILKKNLIKTDAYKYKEIFDRTGALSIVEPTINHENHSTYKSHPPNSVVCGANTDGTPNETDNDILSEKSYDLDNILTQLVTENIHDPIAKKTKWSGVSHGSTFCSHLLTQTESGRFEFRATGYSKLFNTIFVLIGTALILFTIAKMGLHSSNTATGLIVGSLFILFGVFSLAETKQPAAVFDIVRGRFWPVGKENRKTSTESPSGGYTRLEDVCALQIIPVYQGTFTDHSALIQFGKMQLMYGYELNLVLKHGERVYVVNHGDRNKLCEDAATVSRLINKPVWDAVDLIQKYFESNLNDHAGRLNLGISKILTMKREMQRSRRTGQGDGR